MPSPGRWLTRDPIGYQGGINLYGYVESGPTRLIDSDGLGFIRSLPSFPVNIHLGDFSLHGILKRQLWCKNGRDVVVEYLDAKLSYGQKYRKSLADLPGWAGFAAAALARFTGNSADVGAAWKVTGSVSAKYDGAAKHILKSSVKISARASASTFGKINVNLPKVPVPQHTEELPGGLGLIGTGVVYEPLVLKAGASAKGTIKITVRISHADTLTFWATASGALTDNASGELGAHKFNKSQREEIKAGPKEIGTYVFPH